MTHETKNYFVTTNIFSFHPKVRQQGIMSRYFSSEKGIVCHICGGSHARRECPNRICYSCFGVGHQRCDKRGNKGCWGCLGYHPNGNCSSEIFAGEGEGLDNNKIKICVDCNAADHLSCVGLQVPKGVETPEVQCSLCCTMGHTAYDCRKPSYVATLIKHLRSGGSEIRDPRFGFHSQPAELHQSIPIICPNTSSSSSTSQTLVSKREPTTTDSTSGGRSAAAKERRAKKKQKKKEKKKASEGKAKKKPKS